MAGATNQTEQDLFCLLDYIFSALVCSTVGNMLRWRARTIEQTRFDCATQEQNPKRNIRQLEK